MLNIPNIPNFQLNSNNFIQTQYKRQKNQVGPMTFYLRIQYPKGICYVVDRAAVTSPSTWHRL